MYEGGGVAVLLKLRHTTYYVSTYSTTFFPFPVLSTERLLYCTQYSVRTVSTSHHRNIIPIVRGDKQGASACDERQKSVARIEREGG